MGWSSVEIRWASRRYVAAIAGAGLLCGAGLLATSASHADVTPGGLGTQVNHVGNDFDITGGARPNNGTNLFHSFGDFSLAAPESANFLSNGFATTNIISRVTGGNPSNIFGTINTSAFPGANLFLMNPAGIVFGPNAQLNVDGSFHATTADYIGLADGNRFNAVPSGADALLTTAAPAAFGFLTNNPGSIEVQTGGLDDTFFPTALLQVPQGQTLSLVGGNAPGSDTPGVAIGALDGSTPGYVLAPAGRVNLVSVASAGEATFDGTGFNVDGFPQLGTILIGRGLDAGSVDIFNEGASIVDGKDIFIRAGRLEINNGVIVPGGFAFEAFGLPFVGLSPLPDGGQLNIKVTDDLIITGTDFDGLTFATPGIFVYEGDFFDISPEAKVPDVNIDAGSVSISGIGMIQTNRNGPGEPGNVVINTDTLNISSGGSIALFNAFAGPGGELIINAKDVNVSGDGSPSPFGFEGIAAQGVVQLSYLSPFTDPELITADSGNITINADNGLNVTGSGVITTDSRVFGEAGTITINAGDIFLAGTGEQFSSAIATQSIFAGDASDLTINAARTITMKDGARITSSSFSSGDAGNVNITAGDSISLSGENTRILGRTNPPIDSTLDALLQEVFLQDLDSLREEMGNPDATMFEILAFLQDRGDIQIPDLDLTAGDAGTVSVTTPALTLNDGAFVETSTGWDGNAGAVEANVESLSLNNGGSIRSRSGIEILEQDGTLVGPAVGSGNAGNVSVNATGDISISGTNSAVSTTTFGDGDAGSISLTANQVAVGGGGGVTSESGGMLAGQFLADSGNAGTVTISATGPLSVTGTNSTVSTTTSGAGQGGDVDLTGNGVDISGGGSVTSEGLSTGDAGFVNITAMGPSTLTISDAGSTVSTTSTGAGAGGSIELTGNNVQISNGGSVTADSLSTGNTGNITITAGNKIDLNDGTISTRAVTSDGGNIALTAPEAGLPARLGDHHLGRKRPRRRRQHHHRP